MTDARSDQHLEAEQVAAYVDGVLAGTARASVEDHLSICAACREELAEVSGIVATMPVPHRKSVRRRVWMPAAAAAVLALVLARPLETPEPTDAGHRQGAVLTTVAPRAILPVDTVGSVSSLVWSAVPGADRYRVRLFDAAGTVLWEAELPDTLAPLPDSVRIGAKRSYYWKVEAHTGFDRWAPSDLAEFVLERAIRR